MKKAVMGILFISLTLTLAGCGVNTDKGPLVFSNGTSSGANEIKTDPLKNNDPLFANLQKTFFQTSCLKCHNAEQTRHIDLSSKEIVLKNFDEIIRKITSPFVPLKPKDGPMPPKAPSVSVEVIEELKAWRSDVLFSNVQKNLIQVSCLKCHNAEQTRHSNLTSKEVILKNYDEIIRKTSDAFTPLNANDKPMPPKGPVVSRDLINQLESWKNSL